MTHALKHLNELLGPECSLEDAANGAAETAIAGITANSREVVRGSLFAAMPGTKVDGAEFAKAAVEAGAVAVLAGIHSPLPDLDVPIVRAAEPRLALAKMAARFFDRQPATIAAVTGTAGKTSVASFLRQIWEQAAKTSGAPPLVPAMIGTTGVFAPGRSDYGSLTTPDPVALHALLAELAHDGVTHCSMEASSHGLDQRRLDGVEIAVGGFTNLGHDHLDYHPSVDDYLKAKLGLFERILTKGQPAVIFADDAYSNPVIETAKARGLDVLSVGRNGAFLTTKRVEQHRYSQIAEIGVGNEIHRIEMPMAGEFQLSNGLVAAGMAIATGTPAKTALAALEHLKGAPGRLELVGQTGLGAPIYVDYAHKPEALKNVLAALRPYTTGKLVVVFGCGGDRDKLKRPVMGAIAQELADAVIITDDNPRTEDAASVRGEILTAVPDATEIADRREAIFHAVSSLEAGDTLVVAGKGHEEGQIVGAVTLPFSDHKVIVEALEALH